MKLGHRRSAEAVRSQLESGVHDPLPFRAALEAVPPAHRDAWVDLVLGLQDVPDDGPELPRDCVPYLPCPVEALLRIIEHAPIRASDTFVDVGSGPGRAAAFVHLVTGAGAVGIEIQPRLVAQARALAGRLRTSRLAAIEGDAARLAGFIATGSIFFLYCPFSGERLTQLLAALEQLAHNRTLHLCCVNLPLPPCSWLQLEHALEGDISIYRSTSRSSRNPGA